MKTISRSARSCLIILALAISSDGLQTAFAQQANDLNHLPAWAQNSVVKGKLANTTRTPNERPNLHRPAMKMPILTGRQENTTPPPNTKPLDLPGNQQSGDSTTNPLVPQGSVPSGVTTPQDDPQPKKLDQPLELNLQDQVNNGNQIGQQEQADRPRARPSKIAAIKYAGWREAGQGYDDKRLGTQLRANWVMVDRSGRVGGRVVNYNPLQGQKRPMKIYLISKGQVVNSTNVESDGSFDFTGVKQTTYTLVGVSENQFFAFGFNAIDFNDSFSFAPTSLQVAAMPAAVGFTAAWLDRFGPMVKFRNYGVFEVDEKASDPSRLYGTEGLSNFMPSASPATSLRAHTIGRSSDGRLIGRIHQIDSLHGRPVDVLNTTVALTNGSEVIAHTSTDNYGVFEFKDVEPGDYGLFAVGNDGVGAMGIQVVENGGGVIDFSLATSETIGWINHTLKEEDYINRLLQPRPELNNFNPACGGQDCWRGLLQSLYRPLRDTGKIHGCYKDNKLFHENCGRGGCNSGGCGTGGCGVQGCTGGCGVQGCTGGCATGGCQTGTCGTCNSCQNKPHPCLGAAFKERPKNQNRSQYGNVTPQNGTVVQQPPAPVVQQAPMPPAKQTPTPAVPRLRK